MVMNVSADVAPVAGVVLPACRRLLCIDSELDSVEEIAAVVAGHSIQLLRAESGMQGYWLALSERPDAIVLDHSLTTGGDAHLLEALKANPHTRDIPTIVVASDGYPGIEDHVRRLGAVGYLPKPINADALMKMLLLPR